MADKDEDLEELTLKAMDKAKLSCMQAELPLTPEAEAYLKFGVLAGIGVTYRDMHNHIRDLVNEEFDGRRDDGSTDASDG